MESAMSQPDSSNLQLSQVSLREYRQLERTFLEQAAQLIANRELLQAQLDKTTVLVTKNFSNGTFLENISNNANLSIYALYTWRI